MPNHPHLDMLTKNQRINAGKNKQQAYYDKHFVGANARLKTLC